MNNGNCTVIRPGFGTREPLGHVDFYPNGGEHQPGCSQGAITDVISDFFHGGIKGMYYKEG
jgi:hypothetical protein